MSTTNISITAKVAVDAVEATIKQFAKFREVKAQYLAKKSTEKPYHDFYNDPNQ